MKENMGIGRTEGAQAGPTEDADNAQAAPPQAGGATQAAPAAPLGGATGAA